MTDLYVCRIGFGCSGIGGFDYGSTDDRDSIAAVHCALEQGVNLFDTADIYGLGHSEEVLGRALKGRTETAYIATKVGVRWADGGGSYRDLSPAWVVSALEASLKRLQTDCIALYQLHWPDPATPIGDTLAALEKCRQAGKIRYLGCCNLSLAELETAQQYACLDSLQVSYNLADRAHKSTMQAAQERFNMGVLTYNALAQGLFSGKYTVDTVFQGSDLRRRSAFFQGDKREAAMACLTRLTEVALRIGRTPLQVALRWALDFGPVTCALTGIKHAWQVQDNIAALGWRLSEADRDYLDAALAPEQTMPDQEQDRLVCA
jgi:aryl-alcohol dehydrogenase-like predicted oxidoreductase